LPKLERLDAKDAERRLVLAGFELIRTKGSHRIYRRGNDRITIPFHGKDMLHPKIVAQVLAVTRNQ